MSNASLPENERERLLALLECDVLDTPRDSLFDSITTLAAQACAAPIALFCLIDEQRQWFKSNHGLPGIEQTPRDVAFCAHTILGDEMLEVADATRDDRFFDNPLVMMDPKVRFYAGVPLRDPRGMRLGALCVMDRQSRRLTSTQRVALESLSRLAASLLEQRREARKLRQSEERQRLLADLGQHALADPDSEALLQHTVGLLSQTLDFEHCRVLELTQGGRSLLCRAAVGSQPEGQPAGDGEFGSRVALLIPGPQEPFGLLELSSARTGRVTSEVTNFVQSVANIVGTALARRRADERLAYAAQFDILTGLPNRQLFRDRVTQSIARGLRKSRPVAVLVLNLDGFKLINNAHGHAAGDQVLMQVAERLISCVSAYDSVSRLGADEFAIAFSNIERIDEVAPMAQSVLHALTQPFDLADGEVFISATAGVSLFGSDGSDADALIKNAELAMHRARERGRSTYQFFAPDMNQRGVERARLDRGLRRALDRGEFLLHYQPKISAITGRIQGAEALLRWRHPERGLVGPAEFIPILEDTGLIVPVGQWALETACAQLRSWERAGIDVQSVSINLSARQFQQPHFDTRMCAAIESSGLAPGKIELEITESVLMRDPLQAIQILTRLRQSGVALSVDDFGTGYSGLSYLKQLPLDSLKIARNFISNVTHDADDAAIALAIINLAHNLGLKVVAEGVETEAQARFLAAQRCDFLQGFYFSQPLDGDAYGALERAWKSSSPAQAPLSGSGLILPFHKG